MTTDKLNRNNSNLFELALGEQPTHNKFNYSSLVENQNINHIEAAIGDVNSVTSSNNHLSSHPLRSLNIARIVGPNGVFQSYANPDSEHRFEVTLKKGRNEWLLPHWPIGTDGTTYITVSGLGAVDINGLDVFSSDVTPNIPTNTGEYCYDSSRCSIISFLTPVNDNALAQYRTHIKANLTEGIIPFFSGGHGAESLNVIPGLDVALATNIIVETSTSTSYSYMIKIGLYNNGYRTPPISEDYSGLGAGGFSSLNTAEELRKGVVKFPDIVGGYYPTPLLPHQLRENYSADELIPAPFIKLWDDASTSFVPRGNFYYRNETSLYYSNGIALSTGTTNYRIVCVANNISEKIDAINFDMNHHDHKGPRAISHFDLVNLGWPADTSNAPSGYSGAGKSWNLPLIPYYKEDPHPQYLLRHGFLGTNYPNLGNSLMGNLRFARRDLSFQTSSPAELLDSAGESYGVEFAGSLFGMKLNAFDKPGLEVYGDLIVEKDLESTVFVSENNSQIHGVTVGGGQTYFDVQLSTAVDFCSVGLNDITIKTNKNSKITFVGNGTLTATNVENSEVELRGNNHTITVENFKNGHASVSGENITATISGTNKDYHKSSGQFQRDCEARYLWKPITPAKILKVDVSNGQKYLSEKTALDGVGVRASDFVIADTNNPNGVTTFATIGDADFAIFFDMPGDARLNEIQLYLEHKDATFRLYYYQMNGSLVLATETAYTTQSGLHTWSLGTSIGVLGERFPTQSGSGIDLMLLIKNPGLGLVDDYMKIYGGQYKVSLLRF